MEAPGYVSLRFGALISPVVKLIKHTSRPDNNLVYPKLVLSRNYTTAAYNPVNSRGVLLVLKKAQVQLYRVVVLVVPNLGQPGQGGAGVVYY